MESQQDRYLKELQRMHEDEFTKSILKPLFEAMGYLRVDFNGGPLERGRDLIAQIKVPPKREPDVIYIQSKKIGNIQNAMASAKFSQLLHQLRQCCSEEVTTIDGAKLKADKIYLACPEQMTSRFLDEVSGQIFDSFGKTIMPYDGPRIIEDIKEYLPSLLSKLTCLDRDILRSGNEELVNKELLSALKSKKHISLDIFYSDLNFFVGSMDSNLLLHLKPQAKSSELIKDKTEWESTNSFIEHLSHVHGLEVSQKSTSEIEQIFQSQLDLYLSEENKEKMKLLEDIEQDLLSSIRKRREELGVLKNLVRQRNVDQTRHSETDLDKEDQISILSLIETTLEKHTFDVRTILKEIPKDDFFYPRVKDILDLITPLKKSNEKIEELKTSIAPEPKYIIDINTSEIIRKIEHDIKVYRDTVESINNGTCGVAQLKKFLRETEKTLTLIGLLNSPDSPLSDSIHFKHESNHQDRVSISPHDIFSTGHDIAVYGGAGVGKTTTLQAYVTFFSDSENRTLIYVPLNRLIQRYRNLYSESDVNVVRKNFIQKLLLISKNQDPTEENISTLNKLLTNETALILDGLDEIYNTLPYILDEISKFKRAFPHVQLIISSRDCVSYLNEINFLGITLLPFTPEQLRKFISGWLSDETKASKLIEAIDKKGLYEHIKTPLLATISCSLVERGIFAPSSEYEIYSERLNLLTGEYDDHKDIIRQTQSKEHLKLCARKAAFSMHEKKTRSVSKAELFQMVKTKMPKSFSESVIEQCLNELIDPCNLFIEDSLTGHFSFGHFRFQEHLASTELSTNRSIDLAELTVQDWWRGTLCLYSQANDIEHLFEEIYQKYSSIQKSKISLEAMIKHSRKDRRNDLRQVLKMYDMNDLDDRYLLGIDDDFLYSDF